jgi:hypothetical protein
LLQEISSLIHFHPPFQIKIVSLDHPRWRTHGHRIRGDILVYHRKGPYNAMFPDRYIWKNTGIISNPRIGPDVDITGLNGLLLAGANDISRFAGIVNDHHIRRDSHVILNDDPVAGADDTPFGDDDFVPDKKKPFLRFLIFRVEINARISFDPDVISKMDESRAVDHHP